MRYLHASLLTLALATPALSQRLYVDPGAAPGGDGMSWATAYNDLQAALNAATAGTTLWLDAGFYNGTFTVPAGVTVKGGFVGDNPPYSGHVSEIQRSVNNISVIRAIGAQSGLTLGEGSVVDGLQVFLGNAAGGGGAMLIDGVTATVRNCLLQFNNDGAGQGAAILVRNGGNATVESTVVNSNGQNPGSGAAVEIDGATATLTNLTIDLNGRSGVLLRNGATVGIYNSIFSRNGIGGTGYGIEQVDAGTDPIVEHCLFHGNTSGPYLHGSTVVATVAALNALPFASNNIDGDPLYAASNNYRLQATSPAIDAGGLRAPTRNQAAYDQPRLIDGDLDGNLRIDIGAAEFSHVAMFIPVDIHRHIHIQVTGTDGMFAFLLLNAGYPTGELTNGFRVPFIGHLFVNPLGGVVIPFSSMPVPPSNAIINYPPGVRANILTYWQAITAGGNGINLSNPTVHVTNPHTP